MPEASQNISDWLVRWAHTRVEEPAAEEGNQRDEASDREERNLQTVARMTGAVAARPKPEGLPDIFARHTSPPPPPCQQIA